jgi:hypothetical protein
MTTATAKTPVRAFILTDRHFKQLLKTHPGVELQVNPDALRDLTIHNCKLESGNSCFACFLLGDRPHHENARISQRSSEVKRLGQRRNAQRRDPRVERRT